MEFEWDDGKCAANILRRRIDFRDAKMKRRTTTKRFTLSRDSRGETDWERLDAQTDREVARAAASDPDAAPVLDGAWFRRAKIVLPEPKQPVSLRLDRDVLDWFRKQGRGYQTRINAVLRAYVRAQR